MFKHAASLRRKLVSDGEAASNNARIICLDDLNAMGLRTLNSNISDLDEDNEIEFLTKRFAIVKMKRQNKTHELTWRNGIDDYELDGKLDHVFADESLKLMEIDGIESGEAIGCSEKGTNAQTRKRIDSHSVHAFIYGEIHS